jgi:hypothetical protein
MNIAGKRVKSVRNNRKIKREKKIYDQEILTALKEPWEIFDYICSKRLAPFLKEIIPVLEKWEDIMNLPAALLRGDSLYLAPFDIIKLFLYPSNLFFLRGEPLLTIPGEG